MINDTAYVEESARTRLTASIAVDPSTGCWLWTKATDEKGYGRFYYRSREVAAHRAVYEATVGPIPDGLQLDHLCRVRACVNPEHLEPVTCRENLMRGDTLAARQAARTACPAGHPYSGDNLRLRPDGRRECRTCLNAAARRYKAAKRRNRK